MRLNPGELPNDIDRLNELLNASARKFGLEGNIRLSHAEEYRRGKGFVGTGGFRLEIENPADKAERLHLELRTGPHGTLLVRQGSRWQMFSGELPDMDETGFSNFNINNIQEVSPIDSLVKRLTFTQEMAKKQPDNFLKQDMQSLFYKINVGQEGATQGFHSQKLGVVPPTNLFVDEHTSPDELLAMANVRAVNIFGDTLKAQKAVHAQLNASGSPAFTQKQLAEMGYSRANFMYALLGGGLDAERNRFVLGTAFGSLVEQMSGDQTTFGLIGMTDKIDKPYLTGRRDQAFLLSVGYKDNRAAQVLPTDDYIKRSTISFREGQGLRTGLSVSAFMPQGAIPWQSGMGIMNLPKELNQQLQAEDSVLAAGYKSRDVQRISGITSYGDILGKVKFDTSIIGKKQAPNVQYRYATAQVGGDATDFSAMETQESFVTGYGINLPASWYEQREANQQNIATLMEQSGASYVTFGARDNQVELIANQMYITGMGGKGRGHKFSVNPSPNAELVANVPGIGALSYDAMFESKNVGSAILSHLETMQPGTYFQGQFEKGSISAMVDYLYASDPTYSRSKLADYMMRNQDSLSIEGIGKALGFKAPELFMSSLTSKILQQTPEGKVLPFSDINAGVNKRLIEEFGIGRISNPRTPLLDLTPETKPLYEQTVMNALTSGGVMEEGGNYRKYTEDEARALMKERLDFQFDKEKGIYTVYGKNMEGLLARQLVNPTIEFPGKGTDQGLYAQSMQAFNQEDLLSWFNKNYGGVSRETPVARAAGQMVSSYSHTLRGSFDPNSVIVGKDIKVEDIQALLTDTTGKMTSTQILKRFGEGIQSLLPEEKQGRPLYFPQSGVTTPIAESFLEMDSLQKEFSEEGIENKSVAHVADRAIRVYQELAESQMLNSPSLGASTKLIDLLNNFIRTPQLRKTPMGGFARTGGSAELMPHETVISPEFQQRLFINAGGNIKSKQDLAAFNRMLAQDDTFALATRPPNTVMGSEGMPGSTATFRMLTEDNSEVARRIIGQYKAQGLRMPDIIQSMFTTSTMGDFDLDPLMYAPLFYKDKKNKWHKWRPDKEKYDSFISSLKANSSLEYQRGTFERVYGELAKQYNPLDESIYRFMSETGIDPEGSLFYKGAAKSLTGLRKRLEDTGFQKIVAMGQTYNIYNRMVETAGAYLGMPAESMIKTRDLLSGYYQSAVDKKYKQTAWAAMMTTGGLYENKGGASFGFMTGYDKETGKPTYASGLWNPEGSEGSFITQIGQMVASQSDMSASKFAALFTAVPERDVRWEDKDYNAEIYRRQQRVEQIINDIGPKFFDPESAEAVNLRTQAFAQMQEEGLVGMNSIAGENLATRIVSYAMADPTREIALQRLSTDEQGRGKWNMFGKKMSYQDLKERQRVQVMMHQFNLGDKGNLSWMRIENMAEIFSTAKKRGFANQREITEMYNKFGRHMGFSDPSKPGLFGLNVGSQGQVILEEEKGLAEFKTRISKERMDKLSQYILGKNPTVNLRSSNYGDIAGFEPFAGGGAEATMKAASKLAQQALLFENPDFTNALSVLNEETGKLFSPEESFERMFIKGGGTKENTFARRMGTLVENTLSNIVSGTDSPIGQKINYGSLIPKAKIQTEGGNYSISTLLDFLKVTKTDQGWNLKITDIKNISAKKKISSKEMQSRLNTPGYEAQSLVQPLALLGMSSEEAKKFAKIFPEGSSEREFFERENFEDLSGVSVTAGMLGVNIQGKDVKSQSDPVINSVTANKELKNVISAMSEGKTLPEGSAYQEFFNETITPEVLENLRTRVGGIAQKAGNVLREELLPVSEWMNLQFKQELGIRAKADTELGHRYGNLELTNKEKATLKRYSSKYKTQYEINKGMSTEAVERGYFATRVMADTISTAMGGKDLEDLLSGASGGGDGGDKNPPVNLETPDDKGKREQRARSAKEAEVSNAEMRKILKTLGGNAAQSLAGGISGKRGYFKGISEETMPQAMEFVAQQSEMWGTVVGDQVVAGPHMKAIQGLGTHLASFFGDNPEIQMEILGAKSPMESAEIARKYAGITGKSYTQMLKSSPEIWTAIKSAEATIGYGKAIQSHIGKMSPNELMQTFGTQYPMMAAMGLQGDRFKDVQEYLITAQQQSTLMGTDPKLSKDQVLPTTRNERIDAMRMAEDFQKVSDIMYEGLKKSKLAGADFTETLKNVQAHFEEVTKSGNEMKNSGATKVLSGIADTLNNIKSAEAKVEKYVRGTETPLTSLEDFTPFDRGERQRLMGMAKRGEIPTHLMGDVYKAYGQEMALASGGIDEAEGRTLGARLGSLGRRMLGGFGLMYMGSIANIAATPMQFGYQEGQARQTTFAQAMGQAMGGFTPQQNIEGNIEMARSYYGGAGWQNVRGMYADVMRNQPWLVETGNIIQSGFGGAAMAGWLGSMGAFGKDANVGKIMTGVGLATAGVAAVSSLWGAYNQVDTNALGVFTHNLRKGGDLLTAQGEFAPKTPFGLKGLNVFSAFGYHFNEEQQEIGKWLGVLDTYQQKAGGDLKDSSRYLQEQMGLDKQSADKYAYMYAQALAGKSELGFSPEVYAQAAGVLTKYGVTMEGGLDTMATMISQGYNPAEIATAYAYSPYRSTAEMQQVAGQYIAGLQKGEIRPPTTLELEKLQVGAERYPSIASVTQKFGSLEEERKFKEYLAEPTDKEWELIQTKAAIAKAYKDAGMEYEEITEKEIERISGRPSEQIYEKKVVPLGEEEPKEKTDEEVAEELRNLLYPEGEEGTRPEFSYIRDKDREEAVTQKPTATQYATIYSSVGSTEAIPGLSPKEIEEELRSLQYESMKAQQVVNITSAYQALGYSRAPMSLEGMSLEELRTQEKAADLQTYIQQRLSDEGINIGDQNWIGELRGGKEISAFQRLLSGDARQWTSVLRQYTPQQQQALNMMTFDTRYGQQVAGSVLGRMADINMQGQMTGYSWGTTSLQSGTMSALQNANLIFGSDWSKYGAGSGVINAMVGGFTDRAGNTYGGMMGAQLYMNEQQYQTQMSQIGIQFQQIALNKAFTTGVGLDKYAGTINPQTGQPFNFNTGGGGFWGIEDRSRALGYAQQEYGFQMQERQMDMNNRFWQQNFGINFQQSMMQRDWSRQDWGYQDLTRSLQWGWKQEDYQENVRFLTGRDRRLAERQMMRETTMYNLEGEQIDVQRERQEELWDLEDQRFSLQKQQHEETLELQREQLAKSREFYEENKKLQEEQRELSRAYWVEQIALSEASAGASAAAAKQQKDFNDTMAIFKNWIDQDKQALEILFTEGLEAFIKYLEEIGVVIKNIINEESPTSGGGADPGLELAAAGKPTMANVPYSVNDALGGEVFISSQRGNVVPLSNSAVWGQTISESVSTPTQMINMVVYLGDDLLMKKVVEVVNGEVRID